MNRARKFYSKLPSFTSMQTHFSRLWSATYTSCCKLRAKGIDTAMELICNHLSHRLINYIGR